MKRRTNFGGWAAKQLRCGMWGKRGAARLGVMGLAGLSVAGLVGLGLSGQAGAVTYQTSYNLSFTFNPSVTVSLSSSDLVINNLAPGTASDSNVITVNVLSNNSTGYVLNSTVGSSTSPYSTYGRNLVNNADSTATFSSLDYGSSVADMANYDTSGLTNPNVWGYSFSDQTVTTPTWSSYSGLPIYNDPDNTHIATLKSTTTTSAVAGDDVNFKIAAKADTTQLGGEYNNLINFTVVANPAPDLYMQNVASWASLIPSAGKSIQAVDQRDGKTYWVARLEDGNIWMTQNLDHDIVTDGSVTYDSTTTDLPSGTTWTPSTATFETGDTTWASTNNDGKNIPQSYDPGELCWDGVVAATSGEGGVLADHTTNCTSGNRYYHVGNYYNWTASIAMNDSSSYTTAQTDVDQSICPAGWMLPKSGSNFASTSGSFAYLRTKAGFTSGTEGNIDDDPYHFVYTGYWRGTAAGNVGYSGYYWSSVVTSGTPAYALYFYGSGTLTPARNTNRYNGTSVRCVAR